MQPIIKGLCPVLGILFFLSSCLDRDLPDVNGMWQLKTIENTGTIVTVDTIYYSFQRQSIFSYTLLDAVSGQVPVSMIMYGYVDFLEEHSMHIQMDGNYQPDRFDNVPRLERTMNFDIMYLDGKEMILSKEGEIYHFIKF